MFQACVEYRNVHSQRVAVSVSVADSFVKVYLLQNGKKVIKKKTSTKRGDNSPIFNEAMIFSVPASVLQVCSTLTLK